MAAHHKGNHCTVRLTGPQTTVPGGGGRVWCPARASRRHLHSDKECSHLSTAPCKRSRQQRALDSFLQQTGLHQSASTAATSTACKLLSCVSGSWQLMTGHQQHRSNTVGRPWWQLPSCIPNTSMYSCTEAPLVGDSARQWQLRCYHTKAFHHTHRCMHH